MNSFPLMALADCCEIVSGATPSTSVEEYWDGEVCWATPKDLSDLDGHYISGTPRKLTKEGLNSCAASTLPPNSVLFSSRAPIGHVAINTVPMATNQGFKSFVPKADKIDAKFLFYWLRANRSFLESLGVGATFKEVSKAIVSKIKVPVPPLLEQCRIAAILDQADSLRAKRREALAQLDELQQAIFIEMFGDPRTNPKAWPVTTLEHFFEFRTGKLDSNAAVSDGAYPFFTCAKEDYRIDSYAFDCEALLLAGNNANADYSVKHYIGKFNAYQRTYVITLKNPENSYRYSAFFLENHLAELKRVSKGSSTKYLTLGLLNNIRIPVPPPTIQQRFEEQIEVLNKSRAGHLKSQTELEYLFSSLQHHAFRGEL